MSKFLLKDGVWTYQKDGFWAIFQHDYTMKHSSLKCPACGLFLEPLNSIESHYDDEWNEGQWKKSNQDGICSPFYSDRVIAHIIKTKCGVFLATIEKDAKYVRFDYE
jgi:hypothetical protein